MKNITNALMLLAASWFIHSSCIAQKKTVKKQENTREEHLPSLQIISAYYGDSVILRWAPSSWPVWIAGVDGGYIVERYEMLMPEERTDGKDPKKKHTPVLNRKSKQILTGKPLRPFPEEEWKKIFDSGDTLAAMAAHLIYGKRKDFIPGKNVDRDSLLNAYDEQQNLHVMVLLTADRSAEMAKGMALSYTDKTIEKNKSYFYKVYILNENKTTKYDSAGTFIQTFRETPLPAIPNISAEEGEHRITLSWDRLHASLNFTSYIIERSDDNGKSFRVLTLPVFTPSVEKNENIIRWGDSIPENYRLYSYKVTGLTPFGTKGKPSLIQCMGRDRTPPSPAENVKAENISGSKVRLTWEKKQKENDFAGYFIGRGTNMNGPFTPIIKDKLPVSATSYTDDSASVHGLNYYVVAVVDTAGNAKPSDPAYAVMKDNTPPSKPSGLQAKIDSAGVVQLTWKIGSEPDLMGYLVYFANDSSHEFTPVSKEVVPINAFMDTVTLHSLTRNIYYRIAAMDNHRNIGLPSDFIRISRPDTVAPVSPAFVDFKVSDTTITVFWNLSSSTDVAEQVLYRKEKEGTWSTIRHLDKNARSYSDYSVVPKTEYLYSLSAVDASGNSSEKSYPVKGRAFGKDIPEAEAPKLSYIEKDHKIEVRWNAGSYTGIMLIYRNYNNSGLVLYRNTDAKSGIFPDTLLNGPGTYEYTIRIQLPDGSMSAVSRSSVVVVK